MFLARPEWVDWVAGLAPALTVVIATVAVVIASKALKASQASAEQSRRSADHSAASVERADAALRGSVRPILRADPIDDAGTAIEISNVGPGVAVSVMALSASVLEVDGGLNHWGIARTTRDYGPIEAGGKRRVQLSVVDGAMTTHSHLHVILQALDVDAEQHWTEQHWRSEGPYPAVVGVGPLPERLMGYFKNDGVTELDAYAPSAGPSA